MIALRDDAVPHKVDAKSDLAARSGVLVENLRLVFICVSSLQGRINLSTMANFAKLLQSLRIQDVVLSYRRKALDWAPIVA